MAKRTQPTNPAALAAERLRRLEEAADAARADDAHPDRWGVAADQLALERHADVAATRDARGRIAHAHRADVFERMHERGSLSPAQLVAVRRLERDMGVRQGAYWAPVDLLRVDKSTRPEGATERMLEAGARVEAVLAASGARSALLLRALLEPTVYRGESALWREAVRLHTGEDNLVAQAAVVRAACDNLQLAYQDLDRAGRAG
jgi:hypothetical protein